VKFNEFSNTL